MLMYGKEASNLCAPASKKSSAHMTDEVYALQA